jgi:hypothetical protein
VPNGWPVAWIRRDADIVGATAVQIAKSAGSRRRIIVHVSSAYTEAELGLLAERARALLQDPEVGELDPRPEFCIPDIPVQSFERLIPSWGRRIGFAKSYECLC